MRAHGNCRVPDKRIKFVRARTRLATAKRRCSRLMRGVGPQNDDGWLRSSPDDAASWHCCGVVCACVRSSYRQSIVMSRAHSRKLP
jgi:hypothetical protein